MEKNWIDEATGYQALACLTDRGYWCGYVGVTKDHLLYGKGYDFRVQRTKKHDEMRCDNISPISLVLYACDEDHTSIPIELAAQVHGGLTFADRLKGQDDLWGFGFDCAHIFDRDDPKDFTYIESECTKLAKFLKEFEISA